jgi:hypothetical protein|tara:strand:+ start:24509 stop:24661 length:153 start_codon:yes stop_codon:yes gene_type:complete
MKKVVKFLLGALLVLLLLEIGTQLYMEFSPILCALVVLTFGGAYILVKFK